MKRKIFFGGIVLGILIVTIFFTDILTVFTKNQLRFTAVPVESGFFIDCKGLKELNTLFTKNKIDERLTGIPFYEKAKLIPSVLKAIQPKGYSFMDDLLNSHFIIAYSLAKPGGSDIICALELSSASASDLEKLLDAQNGKTLSYDMRYVHNTKVWDVKFNNDLSTWSFSCYRGLCLLSTSSSLVDEAVLQLRGARSIVNDKTFTILKPGNSNSYLQLYFNLSRLSDFAQGYSSPLTQPYLTSLGKFSDWNALEFTPDKGNGIKISGIATTNTTQLRFLNDYTLSKNAKVYSLTGKPDNTAYLLSTYLDPSFTSDNNNTSRGNLLANDADFNKYISPWFKNEATYVLTEPVEGNFELPSLAFIKTRDAAMSLHMLEPISMKSGDSLVHFPLYYKEFEINQLMPTGLIAKVVPAVFSEFVKPYYAAAGDYIVFSNSLTQLRLYLERYKDRKTLDNMDVTGMKTSSYSEGTAIFYFNLDLLADLFTWCSSDDCKASVQEGYKSFKSFSPIYLQYVPSGSGTFTVNGYISLHTGNISTATKYIWKAEIDTAYILPPQIILDRSGNEKRIAVQDAKNVLYVFDRGGDVIWKKQLEAPVMGGIYNIDFYKNEEQQIVFATSKKIYVMNDDGSSLNNFPLTLPYTATSPLSVIDMDNNHDYKFFINCENGYIYGFEKSGKPLAGWNPNTGGKDVSLPVSYFRYRDKEFLMTVTNSGMLNFYNRLGGVAYGDINVKEVFSQPFKDDEGKGFDDITKTGILYRLGYDGKINSINPVQDEISDAILDDLDHKQGLEEILVSSDGVNIYSPDSGLLYHTDINLANNPNLFLVGGHGFEKSIGIKNDDNIYVVDGKGRLMDVSPKKGISTFTGADLFNNNQRVIVGMLDENTVIAYYLEK